MAFKKGYIAVAMIAILSCAVSAEAKLSHGDAEVVWGRVAKATELKDMPFKVKIEKTPNAWVTKGASVTVTTGLLDILDTQAELFGVLAHEAGHINLGHYDNTVKRGVGLTVAATLLDKLFGGGIAGTAVGVGANLAYAGWSREQEVEADDYSVIIAHKHGEDPTGLYSAMLKLSRNGARTEPSGFNSHPPDERRLLHIKNEVLSVKPNAKFPDGTEKTVAQPNASSQPKPVEPAAKPAEKPAEKKTGGYDIDAALERMKKEEAEKKKPAGN